MILMLVIDVSRKSCFAEEPTKETNHFLKCSQKSQATKEVKKERATQWKQVKDLETSNMKTRLTPQDQDRYKQRQEEHPSEMEVAYKDLPSKTRANQKSSRKVNS